MSSRIETLETDNATMKNTLVTLKDVPKRITAVEQDIKSVESRIDEIPSKSELAKMLTQKNKGLLSAFQRPPPPLQGHGSTGSTGSAATARPSAANSCTYIPTKLNLQKSPYVSMKTQRD